MGQIRRFPFIAHYQGATTDFVIQMKHGKVVTSGVGQQFWFLPSRSTISQVPVVDFERVSLFNPRTFEQQEVAVNMRFTYRFADPMLAASRMDFAIYPAPARDAASEAVNKVGDILGQLAASIGAGVIKQMTLAEALRDGTARLDQAFAETMTSHPRLVSSGIELVDCRVLWIRPEAEVEKAIQTPLREQLQADADRALYERRAQAVEQERVISENELASKIELAVRREKLVAQEGANARRKAEEEAATHLINAQGQAERQRLTAQAKAEEITMLGEAENAKQREYMAIQSQVGVDVLQALAIQMAAQNLPAISQVNLTPDMLTALLGKLTSPSPVEH